LLRAWDQLDDAQQAAVLAMLETIPAREA